MVRNLNSNWQRCCSIFPRVYWGNLQMHSSKPQCTENCPIDKSNNVGALQHRTQYIDMHWETSSLPGIANPPVCNRFSIHDLKPRQCQGIWVKITGSHWPPTSFPMPGGVSITCAGSVYLPDTKLLRKSFPVFFEFSRGSALSNSPATASICQNYVSTNHSCKKWLRVPKLSLN